MAALRHCPPWMQCLFWAILYYVVVITVICVISLSLWPPRPPVASPAIVRLFSGVGMWFYAAEAAFLYSAITVKRRERNAQDHRAEPVNGL